MANGNDWVTTTFTSADLDGKKVFFTMPVENEYYTGHFHVLAVNPAGQLKIEIDYGRPPVGNAPPSVGMKPIDQAWVDRIEANIDGNIRADFIIRPLSGV